MLAQPPLYKVKKGNSILYIKNEHDMEDYLIRGGCDDAALVLASGEQIMAQDLIDLVEKNRKARSLIGTLSKNIPEKIIEQMAICGLFDKEVINDKNKLSKELSTLADRLNMLEAEYDRGWSVELQEDGSLLFARTLRGVTEKHTVGAVVFDSPEAQLLHEMQDLLKSNFANISTLISKQGLEKKITGPVSFVDAVMAAGKKGITIQRYKGLGEMNPEQLWETTLDPEARSLLQVKIEDMEQANETFSTLMGDVVEPRKEFIQDNALNVVNLDI